MAGTGAAVLILPEKVLLGSRPHAPSSQGDMHRGKLPESYFGLDPRPLGLAWVGAAEILTWAEKDRPLCQGGTPSLRWPKSGHQRSAAGQTRFDNDQVVRTSVPRDGGWLA